MPDSSSGAPAEKPRRETVRVPVNHVVAFNLMRARKAAGWTQEETAQRLQEVSGQPWSAASVGAAERIARTGRTREFNANELIAFCVAFSQPLAYFFIPPPTGSFSIDVELTMRSKESDEAEQATITEYDLLKWVVPLSRSPLVVDSVQKILYKQGMTWYPPSGTLDWLHPGEDWEGPMPYPEWSPEEDSKREVAAEAGRLGAAEERILTSLGVTPDVVAAEIAQHTREIANMVVAGLLRSAGRPAPKPNERPGWGQPDQMPPF